MHSGVVVSTVASQQRVPGSNPSWGLSVWFVCSPRVCVGSLQVLRRTFRDTKLSLGVSVSVVCLCVAL